MEALITALSSDLYPLIIQSESIRARDDHEREGAHRTKSKLNSAATLTRLHERGPGKNINRTCNPA